MGVNLPAVKAVENPSLTGKQITDKKVYKTK